jgi:hypothetical protein
MKLLTYLLFIFLYSVVTFFGLGPVLLADGSNEERMMTLFIVLIIYSLITAGLVLWRKKSK